MTNLNFCTICHFTSYVFQISESTKSYNKSRKIVKVKKYDFKKTLV